MKTRDRAILEKIHAEASETMVNYTGMTDEEYNSLDEELTRAVPTLGPNGAGFLSQRETRLLGLANLAVS